MIRKIWDDIFEHGLHWLNG